MAWYGVNKTSQMEQHMNCDKCGNIIPDERLEILPHTTTCVKCSVEPKKIGIMVYPHKTGGYCEVINPANKEDLRRAKRFNERAR